MRAPLGLRRASGWTRGCSGVPWEACSCIRPCVHRNTRSTPSTRSCSSCCDGARSSIACSARSSTASSEPCCPVDLPLPPLRPTAQMAPASASPPLSWTSHALCPSWVEGSPPALVEGAPCPCHLLWVSASGAAPGNVLLEFVEIIKPWCVCMPVGFCAREPVATPTLPSRQSKVWGKDRPWSQTERVSDLHRPLRLFPFPLLGS